MASLHFYRDDKYSGLRSSEAVLAAIEELTGDDILNEESEAYRIWREPTPEETAAVETAAWLIAGTDEDDLFWGDNPINPPAQR